MRKLTLDLDSLAVQSFDTSSQEAAGRGTVLGRGVGIIDVGVPVTRQTYPGCPSPLCVDTPLASCDGSCGNSCYDTCNATCGSCNYSCNGSCAGTCADSCAPSCNPSCGPLCVPPIDTVAAHAHL